jgi:hypothetical protein
MTIASTVPTHPWEILAKRRALMALKEASANPAGAGPAAVMHFRSHVITIVSATRDPAVRKIADELIECAEDLFVGKNAQPESYYRGRLFAAHQKLEAALDVAGLLA